MHLKRYYLLLYLPFLGICFIFLSLQNQNLSNPKQGNHKTIKKSENYILDSIEPSCINNINKNGLPKIQSLDIIIPASKKWNQNLYRAITAKSKEMILSKYKRNFKGYVNFKINNYECNLKARIRLSGGRKSHIKINKNSIASSLDIHLKEGNINGFTKFKLFLPRERNYDSEIITSLLFRELGFISPRSSYIYGSINGVAQKYIIQEKPAKEMLEYHKLRESAILGTENKVLYQLRSRGNRLSDPYMSMIFPKLINDNWAKKGNVSFEISFNAIKNFAKAFQGIWSNDADDHITFSDQILSGINNKSYNNLSEYRLLSIAMGAEHAIYNNNRKFYYEPIFSSFYPIYYDGNSQISSNYKITKKDISNMENIIQEINKETIEKLIKKLINIDLNKLSKLFYQHDLVMDYSSTQLVINNLINNLKFIKNNIPESKIIIPVKSPHYKYRDFSLDYGIAFSRDNNKYKLCEIKIKECSEVFLNMDSSIKLMKGDFSLNETKYYFAGNDYKNYSKGFIEKEKSDLSFYDKKDLKFYYLGNPFIDVNHKEKKINISIKSESDKIIFSDIYLKDWTIKIKSIKKTPDKNINKFDRNLLTGLLTIKDSYLENINIEISGGVHEDSLNIINSKGKINKITINNSFQDAIDLDFSNLEIKNIQVSNAGNDCLDLSAGKYNVYYLSVDNCLDKGISLGEDSDSYINLVSINNVEVGIATKDSSFLKIREGIVQNYEICAAAYRKKQEFSGSIIVLNHNICPKEDILIQKNSYYISK